MYTCIHGFMHTCILTYIHIYTYIYIHTYIYIFIYRDTYIYTYIHIYIYAYIHIYILTSVIMIQFSSTKDSSTSCQGLATLWNNAWTDRHQGSGKPGRGRVGIIDPWSHFCGATVFAETGSLLLQERGRSFPNRCCSSCETILCVLLKTKTGAWDCRWTFIQQGFPLIRVSGLLSLFWLCLQFCLKRGPHQLHW